MIKLSLAVPCFNEQDNVEMFYKAVRNVFDGKLEYEIVFVDDGSSDDTYARLKAIYDLRETNVKVIRFSRNFGKEAALYAALEHCRGTLTCIIDADMQQRPETVMEMVNYLDGHPDCDCVAAYQDKRIENPFISLCKACFYSAVNKVSDVHLYPSASDFRTFRGCVRDAVLSLGERRRFSKGIFAWVGFDTYYMPYTAEERHSGKSKFNFRKLMKYAIDGIVAFTTAPLRIPLYLGGLFSAGGIIWLIVTLLRKLSELQILMAYILLMTGILLLSVGIAAEYIAHAYTEEKDRPIYIEKTFLTYEEDRNGKDQKPSEKIP